MRPESGRFLDLIASLISGLYCVLFSLPSEQSADKVIYFRLVGVILKQGAVMGTEKQKLGKWGEGQAANYLIQQGYEILERNARTRYGEIDLVARHLELNLTTDQPAGSKTGKTVVFVEVKTRTSLAFGYPEQAIDRQKQAHMLAAAEAYLQDHPELGENWRLDVISIQRFSDRPPDIMHFENVVTA